MIHDIPHPHKIVCSVSNESDISSCKEVVDRMNMHTLFVTTNYLELLMYIWYYTSGKMYE